MTRIKENLKTVLENISRAARKAGRDPSEVKLVCVTKTVGTGVIEELHRLGQRLMGENRLQVAKGKIAELSALDIEWHMIGHLQTNKVKAALEMFQYLHAVDTLKLAKEISRRAVMMDKAVKILLEVNVSGEASKYGCRVDTLNPGSADEQTGVFDLAASVSELPGVDLQGLMTMAPFVGNEKEIRGVFRRLRELRDEINERSLCPYPLQELSMGMTNDYTAAIEEGATFVRIGSGLFV